MRAHRARLGDAFPEIPGPAGPGLAGHPRLAENQGLEPSRDRGQRVLEADLHRRPVDDAGTDGVLGLVAERAG